MTWLSWHRVVSEKEAKHPWLVSSWWSIPPLRFYMFQMEGGQVQAEKFVRLLYNGRVVRPNFCQREECPLRTYRSHVMQFLVPENLEV